MERNYDVTPVLLQESAKSWIELYEYGIKGNIKLQIPAVCCLLFALEFYLKAYLSLKDKKFSKYSELKDLGHSMRKIFCEVEKLGPSEFVEKVRKLLNDYGLFTIDPIELRYPLAGQVSSFHRNLFDDRFNELHDKLNELFKYIDEEIRKWDYESWKNKVISISQ